MASTLSVAGFVVKTYLPSRLTATSYGLPYWSFSVLVVAASVFPVAAAVVQPGGESGVRNAADGVVFFAAGFVARYAPPPPTASSTTRAPPSTAGERRAGRRPLGAGTASGQTSVALAGCASVSAEPSSAGSISM